LTCFAALAVTLMMPGRGLGGGEPSVAVDRVPAASRRSSGFVIITPGQVRTEMSGPPNAPLDEDSVPGVSTRSRAKQEGPVFGISTARAARFGGDPLPDG